FSRIQNWLEKDAARIAASFFIPEDSTSVGGLCLLERYLAVGEGPLLHEANSRGNHSVEDEVRILKVDHVIANMGIAVPDFRLDRLVGDELRHAGDAHLVILAVKLADLDARVGLDLGGLAVRSKVGDVNGETIRLDR